MKPFGVLEAAKDLAIQVGKGEARLIWNAGIDTPSYLR
jgi:hypothetical protein